MGIFASDSDTEYIKEQLLENGKIENYELLLNSKSKKIINGLYSGEIVEIMNEKYVQFCIHDITTLKKAEIVLKNNASHIAEIINKRSNDFNKKLEQYKLIFDSANVSPTIPNRSAPRFSTILNISNRSKR